MNLTAMRHLIFLLFICQLANLTISKKFTLCNFVKEVTNQGVLSNDLFKHVCIASFKTNFRSDYNTTGSYGIYALQQNWFKDCNATKVEEFLDDNIDNDIQCAEKILQQNSGGVRAWGEDVSCNHLRPTLDQCFD